MNYTPTNHVHTKTDFAIQQIINNDQPLTQADLNRVYTVAQTEPSYIQYRDASGDMGESDLLNEKHNSSKMAKFLERAGDPRPHTLCDCHAIVCGSHPRAQVARLILAKFGMRIDDICNACWLPRNTAAIKEMPSRLANAVPHSRVHRKKYFNFVEERLGINYVKNTTQLKHILRYIAFSLQSGSIAKVIFE